MKDKDLFVEGALSAPLYTCTCGAFSSCPYHDTDDEFCEICIKDGLKHLKSCLNKLREERRFRNGSC